MHRLKAGWYNLLNGNITINSVQIPVYREDADKIPSSHYILIRAGGARNERTSDAFIKKIYLFIQIVTKFTANTGINDTIVDLIDEQIGLLALPTPFNDALNTSGDIEFINVAAEDETYETFVDEENKYHIKTVRWEHTAVQL